MIITKCNGILSFFITSSSLDQRFYIPGVYDYYYNVVETSLFCFCRHSPPIAAPYTDRVPLDLYIQYLKPLHFIPNCCTPAGTNKLMAWWVLMDLYIYTLYLIWFGYIVVLLFVSFIPSEYVLIQYYYPNPNYPLVPRRADKIQ